MMAWTSAAFVALVALVVGVSGKNSYGDRKSNKVCSRYYMTVVLMLIDVPVQHSQIRYVGTATSAKR